MSREEEYFSVSEDDYRIRQDKIQREMGNVVEDEFDEDTPPEPEEDEDLLEDYDPEE